MVCLLTACGREDTEPAAWGPLVQVSDGETDFDAFAPAVAMDGLGSAVVVWGETRPSFQAKRSRVLAARQTADGTWLESVTLDDGEGLVCCQVGGHQSVVMNAAGDAVATWTWAREVSPSSVYVSHSSAAEGWTPGQPLDPRANAAPRVGLDASGDGLAVWSVGTIWVKRLAGGKWGPRQSIQSPRAGPIGIGSDPDLAVSPDGTALAVWTEVDAGVYRIWSNRFRPQSGWGSPVPVSHDGMFEGALFADVAMDFLGGGIAAWERSAAGVWGIATSRYEPGRGWQAPLTLAPPGQLGDHPQTAMDAAGNALVVWRGAALWAARFSTRLAVWEQPVQVASQAIGPVMGLPRIATDARGNATLVWRSLEPGGVDRVSVHAVRFAPVGGWGNPEVLDTYAFDARDPRSNYVGEVVVAAEPQGDVIAAWSRSENGRFTLRARRFGAPR